MQHFNIVLPPDEVPLPDCENYDKYRIFVQVNDKIHLEYNKFTTNKFF